MTHTTISILLDGSFSIFTIFGFAVAGFIGGFLIRIAINAKQKRHLLKMEDEMLSNHSRILSLEKKISKLQSENQELSQSAPRKTASLRAS
jgi:hypothetical protein